jgi:hypothetical protein
MGSNANFVKLSNTYRRYAIVATVGHGCPSGWPDMGVSPRIIAKKPGDHPETDTIVADLDKPIAPVMRLRLEI